MLTFKSLHVLHKSFPKWVVRALYLRSYNSLFSSSNYENSTFEFITMGITNLFHLIKDTMRRKSRWRHDQLDIHLFEQQFKPKFMEELIGFERANRLQI